MTRALAEKESCCEVSWILRDFTLVMKVTDDWGSGRDRLLLLSVLDLARFLVSDEGVGGLGLWQR